MYSIPNMTSQVNYILKSAWKNSKLYSKVWKLRAKQLHDIIKILNSPLSILIDISAYHYWVRRIQYVSTQIYNIFQYIMKWFSPYANRNSSVKFEICPHLFPNYSILRPFRRKMHIFHKKFNWNPKFFYWQRFDSIQINIGKMSGE